MAYANIVHFIISLVTLCEKTASQPSCQSAETAGPGLSLLQSSSTVSKFPHHPAAYHDHKKHKLKKRHGIVLDKEPVSEMIEKEKQPTPEPVSEMIEKEKEPKPVINADIQDGQWSLALDAEAPGMEQIVTGEVEGFLKTHVATAVRDEIGKDMRDALKEVVRGKVGVQGSMKKLVKDAVKDNMALAGGQVMKDKVQLLLKAKVREALKTIVADQVRDNARNVLENVTGTMVGEKLGAVLKDAVSERVKAILHSRTEIDDALEQKMGEKLGSKLEDAVKKEVDKKMGKVLKETIQAQMVETMQGALKEAVEEEVKDSLDKQEVLEELKEQALAGVLADSSAINKKLDAPQGKAEADAKKAVEAEHATPPKEKDEESVEKATAKTAAEASEKIEAKAEKKDDEEDGAKKNEQKAEDAEEAEVEKHAAEALAELDAKA